MRHSHPPVTIVGATLLLVPLLLYIDIAFGHWVLTVQ